VIRLKQARVGLQTDRNIAAGCVRKKSPRWRHFLAPLLLPFDINRARQTAGFSVRGFSPSRDRQTERPLPTHYLLDAAAAGHFSSQLPGSHLNNDRQQTLP